MTPAETARALIDEWVNVVRGRQTLSEDVTAMCRRACDLLGGQICDRRYCDWLIGQYVVMATGHAAGPSPKLTIIDVDHPTHVIVRQVYEEAK